jgi:hypothetical protein
VAQITSATNFTNQLKEIAAAARWESGKRSLFSIFSTAFFNVSSVQSYDALLHLDLESAEPLYFVFVFHINGKVHLL